MRTRNRRPKTNDRILDYLEYHPGARLKEIAEYISEPLQTVFEGLKKLRLAGKVSKVGYGQYSINTEQPTAADHHQEPQAKPEQVQASNHVSVSRGSVVRLESLLLPAAFKAY